MRYADPYEHLRLMYKYGDDIPLRQIANMRHRMVHACEGVNWNVVEEAAFEDVPHLIGSIEKTSRKQSIRLDFA